MLFENSQLGGTPTGSGSSPSSPGSQINASDEPRCGANTDFNASDDDGAGAAPSVSTACAAKVDGTFRSRDASTGQGSVPYEHFAEVAPSYLSQLYTAARRFTHNAADADDLVQDTYYLAFRNYRELHSLANCRAWLHRILHRQAITRYRRQRVQPLLFADGTPDDRPEPTSVNCDTDPFEHRSLQEVHAAFETLPSDLRIAVTLCDIEGFSYVEIANLAGCPVGTVRSRISRARSKLIRALRLQAEEWGIHRTMQRRPDRTNTIESTGAAAERVRRPQCVRSV